MDYLAAPSCIVPWSPLKLSNDPKRVKLCLCKKIKQIPRRCKFCSEIYKFTGVGLTPAEASAAEDGAVLAVVEELWEGLPGADVGRRPPHGAGRLFVRTRFGHGCWTDLLGRTLAKERKRCVHAENLPPAECGRFELEQTTRSLTASPAPSAHWRERKICADVTSAATTTTSGSSRWTCAKGVHEDSYSPEGWKKMRELNGWCGHSGLAANINFAYLHISVYTLRFNL